MWFFLFVYFLMMMLTSKTDPLALIVRLALPGVNETYQDLLTAKLRLSLQGVFFLPIQIASCHASITLLTGLICGVDFLFFSITITFLMSILQILGGATFLVCLPWALQLLVKFGWIRAFIYVSSDINMRICIQELLLEN